MLVRRVLVCEVTSWEIAAAVGQIASAIGTFVAVAVALYLSRLEHGVRVRVIAGLRTFIVPGAKDHPECVSAWATNIGRRDVTVTGFYFRMPLQARLPGQRTHAYWAQPANPLTTDLPARLVDGAEARMVSTLKEFEQNVSTIAGSARVFRSWRLRRLRVGVYLSTGLRAETRIERSLGDRFVEIDTLLKASSGK